MKKTTFVALLLLTSTCLANGLKSTLQDIESEWAITYYSTPKQHKQAKYSALIQKTNAVMTQHPDRAEPLILLAIVTASNAETQDAISAISAIHKAKDLLLKAIDINPNAMEGCALVTLGTLYYMTPEWPIGFGDNAKAQELLTKALKINPNGVDSNYYYGNFLLSQNKYTEAANYLNKSIAAPSRVEQVYADNQLKEEAKAALNDISEHNQSNTSGLFASILNSQNSKQ